IRFRATDGKITESGNIGTIEVRSPLMAEGYRNAPERQEAAFADGWYRTGDLGWLDAEGFLHVLGRAEDALWSNGDPLTPDLVQETVCQVPEVQFAAVVLDEGTWIVAAVPRPGHTIDSPACQDAIAEKHGIDAASVVMVS